jgi:hypothetical protein
MDGIAWRPARWTPARLEERRLAAATLLRRGQLTQAAIARRLGVSGASVCRWSAVPRRRGRRGLRARSKAGRPATQARCPRLGAPRSATGTRRRGGGIRDRALDLAAHCGAGRARIRRTPPPATSRAPPEGARLHRATPRDPGQGARRAHHRRLAAARVDGGRKRRLAMRDAHCCSRTRPATASAGGLARPGLRAERPRCRGG